MSLSNNPFSILSIADAMDAQPAADPRDRAPPGAPKKTKPDTPSPNDITAIPLFWESAPGAPVANRTRTVKLSTMPMALINLASAYICAGYIPLYAAYKDDVLDGEYEALEDASVVTPHALAPGPFRSMVTQHESLGGMTFKFDTDEYYINRITDKKTGTLTHVEFWIHGMGKWIYGVNQLVPNLSLPPSIVEAQAAGGAQH